MTLDEFAEVASSRILTPDEFIWFVRGQGWEFQLDGDKAAISRVKPDDIPVARATAAMLKREPYRTNVITRLRGEPVNETAPTRRQAEVIRLVGEASAPVVEKPLPTPETCSACLATIHLPGPEIAAICPHPPVKACPYFRLRR